MPRNLLFILYFFLFLQQGYGQLSNFTLTVTQTPETCTGNGSIQFSVSGTQPSSTMLYEVFLLPNVTTPISVTTSNFMNGLVAGTYSIVATQTLGGNSGSQQQNIIVLNNIVPLTYQLAGENQVCLNDGSITVNVTSGSATQYEIFAGPMIRPLQSSNIFANLTAGQYSVRVFDNCGEGVVQTFTLIDMTTNFSLSNFINQLTTCTSSTFSFNINRIGNSIIKYPLQVQITITPSGQSPIQYTQTIASGDAFLTSVFQLISVPANTNFNYAVSVTNGCNETQTSSGILPFNTYSGSFNYFPTSCEFYQIDWMTVQSVTLTNASVSTGLTLPYQIPIDSQSGFFSLFNMPPGQYFFTVVDFCGNSRNVFFTLPEINLSIGLAYEFMNCTDFEIYVINATSAVLTSTSVSNFPFALPYTLPIHSVYNIPFLESDQPGTYTFSAITECNPQPQIISINIVSGDFELNQSSDCINTIIGGNDLQQVTLVNAPATYQNNLPFDYSNTINGLGEFTISGLPAGTYTFNLIDNCNNNATKSITVNSQINNATQIIQNCGSFDVNLNYETVPVVGYAFYLQKFDPVTNQWVHPITENSSSTINFVNAILLQNLSVNYNFAVYGHFRIVATSANCIITIQEFDFFAAPKIEDVFSVACNNNTFDVVVDAVGVPPLQYRIIEKDGAPFVIQNGNQSVFLGLDEAQYKFQVEDACGNILNREFYIPKPFSFGLTASTFCLNENAFLSVPFVDVLTYKWWKNDDESNVLSTSNILNFTSFNDVTDAGIYHVNIKYNHPNSCINFDLEYQILSNSNSPNAGLDTTVSICNAQDVIDLFQLLQGTYTLGGIWEDLSNTNALIGNFWNANQVTIGTYNFKYRVNGNCNSFDESYLIIQINESPETPQITVDSDICEGENIQFFATTIQNVTYEWTGPSGFFSIDQNPIINAVSQSNAGIYYLKTIGANCESGLVETTLNVAITPQFEIVRACINDVATLTVVPLNNSFDIDDVTYNWSNANGSIGTSNPISIENESIGAYSLTVTNAFGCESSKQIYVSSTTCSIPKGISANGDDVNDSFDLSGLNVENLKIFSRYGREVYSKEKYKKEWYGQDYNGRMLPAATYYYYIRLADGVEKTGWVYLITD